MYFKTTLAQSILYILLMIVFSCGPIRNNDAVMTRLDSTLSKMNSVLRRNNQDAMMIIKERAIDERTKMKVAAQLPKAAAIDSLTENMMYYIDSLKWILYQPSYAVDKNQNAVRSFFVDKGQSNELYKRLQQFKSNLMALDERMKEEIKIIDLPGENAVKISNAGDFTKELFSAATWPEAMALLSSLETSIFKLEDVCLYFFIDQIVIEPIIYDEFSEAIVGQNAKILKAGDFLEITSGMGSFNKRNIIAVMINSQKIPINGNGLATYKFKTSNNTGNYSIPVSVTYKDQDGAPQTRTITVNYSLVDTIIKK